ncbi:MAG: flagellin [Phenylobacterium sp.]|uniref:flagellin n=1 Tax=Phenylobacterium sp. TaxID=1871053 RepID=UPI00391DE8A0
MTRVSTVGNYSAVLANLMAAQQRQIDAGITVSTQKNGTSLKEYSRSAEILTAMKSIESRVSGYLEQNRLIADKLETQDFALDQLAESVQSTREAIASALASGRADTLMLELEANFRNGVQAMNTRYGGKYLFAGGQIDTEPVSAQVLSDLTTPPAVIADFFHNDDFVTKAKVDDATTVSTGLLADDLGTDILTAYQAIQSFNEGADGPFGGNLTENQRLFLEGILDDWDGLHSDTVDRAARNGMAQSRVEGVKTDLTNRKDSLNTMIGEITDADMAEAVTRLEQAQLSVQAAAQVFTTLKESSLLNLLQ